MRMKGSFEQDNAECRVRLRNAGSFASIKIYAFSFSYNVSNINRKLTVELNGSSIFTRRVTFPDFFNFGGEPWYIGEGDGSSGLLEVVLEASGTGGTEGDLAVFYT